MEQFWTFSGINSPQDASTGEYIDYTWEFLEDKLRGNPDRRYASRLGTSKRYDKAHNVFGLKAEKKLDREAKRFATQGGGFLVLDPGMFRGKTVKIMLIAPKTTTKPPKVDGLQVEVYWSPRDQVPNQSLIRPDSLTYWRKFARGGGTVWPVENRAGSGLGRGHDFTGFMVPKPMVVTRVRRPRPANRAGTYIWVQTGEIAPAPIATLQGWLDDGANDFVFLAHSQGANIAMCLLRRGYR